MRPVTMYEQLVCRLRSTDFQSVRPESLRTRTDWKSVLRAKPMSESTHPVTRPHRGTHVPRSPRCAEGGWGLHERR
jgi:hypothetical protein